MLVDSPAFITKVLLPRRRADVLRRPRLVDFLHQNIDRRLLLVCAPAGYGKTTLLVDFAHDVDIPVCWYSLGPADVDVRVFLEYLIAAIRQRFPEFGHQTEAVLRGTTDVAKDLSALVGVLVSEMHSSIPQYFIIVLDDFHAVDTSELVKSALDLMLYYLPENCHVVISSRTMPQLTLSRLAAHRQVAGLGNEDLRFTPDEIKQLLGDNHKVLVPGKTAEALASETEGWITGIILTTHTMWQGLFESMIRAKGTEGEIFNYLADEVFAHQPADVQQFLLGTSVLDQLHTETCADLLDGVDAGAKLLYLEEANLFTLRLEGAEGWFRYHQLFKSFLESRLRQQQPEWHLALQRRAARLAAARGAWDEAIGHCCRAGDYGRAADLVVERADDMINAGKHITLARWIDTLPAELVAAQPRLLLVRGRICIKCGETDRALELLDEACARFQATGDDVNAARALAARSLGLAMKLRYAEAIADCQRALAYIGDGDRRLAADVHRNLGICHGLQGQFHQSVVALDDALRLHRDSGDALGVAALHQSLGVTHARLGDLPRSRFHFEQALAAWQRSNNVSSLGETLNSLGALQYEEGEHEEALATLGQALDKARAGNYLRLEASVLADIGDVHRTAQRYGEAIEHYERSLEIARRIEEGFVAGRALNGLGDAYAQAGDLHRAERFIRQAILQAEERQSQYEIGMYETTMAMLRCDQSEPAKAKRSALRACETLSGCGAQRELTRAYMSSARALHVAQHHREALAQFQLALDLGAQIDYNQFLVRDGRRCESLFALARKHGLNDPRLVKALETLRGPSPAPSPPPSLPSLRAVARPKPPPLRALALGQARVLSEGKEITRSGWASDKVRELFFFLLGHSYSLRKEQIVDALWPDLPPGSYNSTFHSTMYRLRRALPGECIVQQDGRYRLSSDVDCYYDVAEFEHRLDEADRLPTDSAQVVAAYRRAIEVYQGPYLKEFDAEWCLPRRQQLDKKRLSALHKLASALAALGHVGESIELCQTALALDNYREDIHLLLLKCYAAQGDHSMALRHYRRFAGLLRDELGVTPSAKLKAFYEQILRGHPLHA